MLAGAAIVSACAHAADVDNPLSIESIFASGQREFRVRRNQPIVINVPDEQARWQVSLGRLDVNQATFTYSTNKTQRTFQFISTGSYRVTVTSLADGGAPNIVRYTLNVIVEQEQLRNAH